MKKLDGNNSGTPIIDEIYIKCLAPTGKEKITGRDVYDYCISPFMVYCERFGPEDRKDPLTEFDRMLLVQGRVHEGQVLKEKYPDLQKTQYASEEEGFRLVLEAMKKGSKAISGAPVFYLPEDLKGVIDVLEKRSDAPSVFGNYHYIVKEIKLAKNLKEGHVYQAAFYNYILGKIQGYTPPEFYLINRDQEEFPKHYDETTLLEKIIDIRRILKGGDVTPTHDRYKPEWKSFNNEEAIRRRDVSLVNDVGPSRKQRLLENGIRTVDDLAKTPMDKLIEIKGIANKTATKLLQSANAIVLGKHVCIGECQFPTKTTEIFLDLEGTGEQLGDDEELIAMDYLIGVLIRKDGKAVYKPFLADNIDKEEEMLRQFVKWLAQQDDFIIYHYHDYESTHLQKMAKRYNLSKKEYDLLFSNMRDIYKDAVSSFAFPTYGNGLKAIAAYIGYEWKHKEVSARESIAIYLQYVQDKTANKENMQRVIDYNEDDCQATLLIKDWLKHELTKK